MKKILIVDGSLAKAHVNSYTRSDGTFVKEHDNGRQAAAPKPAAGDKASIPHGHAGAYFPAHRQRIAEMKHGDSIKIKAGEDEHTLTRDGDNVHIARKKAAPAKKVVVRKEAMADHAAHHSSEADRHMAASTAALKDDFDKGSTLHDKAATAHERAMNAHKSGAANAAELSAAAREASAKADAVFEHKPKPKASAAETGGPKKPSTWQEAQEHAFKAGAKFKSNVAVFNTAENAHSRASRSAGSKGGAFVMKHPDHNFHVVVNGADSQRMEKNGYQHVSPSGR